MHSEYKVLTFDVNNITYGFNIDDINGVNTSKSIKRVETPNKVLIGSVEYRNTIIEALSISKILFDKYENNNKITFIVLNGYNKALVIDSIDKIININSGDIDIITENNTIIKNDIDIIDNFIKSNNNIISILNKDKFIRFIENKLK